MAETRSEDLATAAIFGLSMFVATMGRGLP